MVPPEGDPPLHVPLNKGDIRASDATWVEVVIRKKETLVRAASHSLLLRMARTWNAQGLGHMHIHAPREGRSWLLTKKDQPVLRMTQEPQGPDPVRLCQTQRLRRAPSGLIPDDAENLEETEERLIEGGDRPGWREAER